ncbi:hypothetical protein [Alteromonas sp. KUL49]|uniref:hypothetical protein n=1 Tax=Alteromonas sp. KUL49 TaxID=2480798 RepID=UPI0010D28558|nr:hypothetical protein [Alteromonas sp. KUL49]TAP39701.1 hypothetical protein EYS00_10245 [Alteromonas sp. KUL49]GEA11691.1 hypothetical protein KUL49_20660 [Alteromonas sp. KUL49]
MRIMKFVLTLFTFLMAFECCSVGIANMYLVKSVRVDASGIGYVEFDKSLTASSTGLPSCTIDFYKNMLAFDTKTDGGKAILSTALTAYTSKKKMWVAGTGTCSVYSVMESWDWGYVKE